MPLLKDGVRAGATHQVIEAKTLTDLDLHERNIVVVGPTGSGKSTTALPWIVANLLDAGTQVYLGGTMGCAALESFSTHVDGYVRGNPSAMLAHLTARVHARQAGVENPLPLAVVLDNACYWPSLTAEVTYLAATGPTYGVHVVVAGQSLRWLAPTDRQHVPGRLVMAPDRQAWVPLALALPGLRVSRDNPLTWADISPDTALVAGDPFTSPQLARLVTT